jgi:death-on-curing protein
VDGNKRIGTFVILILLELNRIEIDLTDNEIIRIGLELAESKMNDTQLHELIVDRL